MYLESYENSEFLFVTSRDKEELSCVNVTDRHNPELFAKFIAPKESAYDVKLTKNKKYAYLATFNGIRILPLNSGVSMHTEFV